MLRLLMNILEFRDHSANRGNWLGRFINYMRYIVLVVLGALGGPIDYVNG